MTEKQPMGGGNRVDVHDPVSVAQAFAEIRGQLDAQREKTEDVKNDIHDISVTLRSIEQSLNKTNDDRESLRRLWQHVEGVKTTQGGHERKLNLWTGMLIGFGVGVSLIISLGVYIFNDTQGSIRSEIATDRAADKQSIQNLDARLDRVEIHMAGDKDNPYQR